MHPNTSDRLASEGRGFSGAWSVRPPGWRGPGHATPERRRHTDANAVRLAHMLDEVDHGLVLVTADDLVRHANRAALRDLADGDHPLCLDGQRLQARRPQDAALLRDALADARARGLRRVLHLGEGSGRILAVVPLPPASANSGPDAMLLLGRREVCRELSLDWFARTHRLTPAETAVLKGLCASRSPKAIATDHGVCVSTVRTQIGSIRAKTGAESIRGVVAMVVQMPQLLGVLDTPAGPPAP